MKRNNMKVLLIGKNGQIGRELDTLANKRAYEVYSFERSELDITDYKTVTKMMDELVPNVVINASGYHVMSDCEKYPEKAFEVNAVTLKHLAQICEKKNVKLINFSTDRVFDGMKKTPYIEDDRTHPLQVYGISKLAGEFITHTYNSQSITIRTCGVFGGLTGSSMKKGNFVLYILEQAKKTKSLEISSDQTASFVNAVDLAKATLQLIEKKAEGGIYHLINEGYGTWAAFAREIVKIAKLDLEIVPVDRSGVYSDTRIPLFVPLRNKKAKLLGIVLPTWQDGLRRYITYLQKHKDGKKI